MNGPAHTTVPGGGHEPRARAGENVRRPGRHLCAAIRPLYLFNRLVHSCRQLLEVDAAAVVIADARGTLKTTAATEEEAAFVELMQMQTGRGPCMDCYRTGRGFRCPVADALGNRTPPRRRHPRVQSAHAAEATLEIAKGVIAARPASPTPPSPWSTAPWIPPSSSTRARRPEHGRRREHPMTARTSGVERSRIGSLVTAGTC